MIYKGFKFGMLLQIAIGPICIYVFNIASNNGFVQGEQAVLAVTLADSLFILLALLGLTSFMENPRISKFFGVFGAIIVGLFGLNILLGAFGMELLPNMTFINPSHATNSFLYAFLLTCANPLTILFWAGVFSTRITQGSYKKRDLYKFGIGAASSTLVSLTIVSIIGSVTHSYVSREIIVILDGIVGLILILFALKMLLKNKNKDCEANENISRIGSE